MLDQLEAEGSRAAPERIAQGMHRFVASLDNFRCV